MNRGGRGGGGGKGGGYDRGGGGGGGRGGGGYDRGGGGGGRGGGGGGYDRGGRGGGGGQGRGDGGMAQQFSQMNVGSRGGGGGQRGGGGGFRGGGGGGRSRTTVRYESRVGPAFKDEQVTPKPTPAQGWRSGFKTEPDAINKLPERKKDSGLKNYLDQKQIIVNHFPLQIKFPKIIYQYRVDFERVKTRPAAAGDGKEDPKGKKGKKKKGGGGGGGDGAGAAAPARLPGDLIKKIMKQTLRELWAETGGQEKFGIISDFSHAMYTSRRLEESGIHLDREITLTGRGNHDLIGEDEEGSTFKVTISATTERVDTSNLAFDINNMRNAVMNGDLVNLERIYSVLIRCVEINRYTPMKRTDLIDYTAPPHPLGGGVVSYPGYSALLPIANGWKPFLNIEISNMATYLGGNVLNVIQDVLGTDNRSPRATEVGEWARDYNKVNDLLKTCKITYEQQPGKKFSKVVNQLCRQSVSQTMFEYQNRQMSVFTYFTQILKRPLRHPNGPCLECKGNNRPKIPAELCTLKSGQSFNRKLNDSQTTAIAEVARKFPKDLQPAISRAVGALGLMNNPLLRAYGVQMQNNGQMHQVNARVLAPPELCYGKKPGDQSGKKAVIVPDNGEWDIWNVDFNFEFYRNATIAKWAIVNIPARGRYPTTQQTCIEFAKKLVRKAGTRGMNIPEPVMYRELNLEDSADRWKTNVDQLEKVFTEIKNAFGNDPRSFVLVAVPKKGCQVYNHVKQAAELRVKLLTQCIAGQNMSDPKRLESILGNVLLKINSKLTHVNHVVLPPPQLDPKTFTIFNYPTIIIGADVTHPPPGSTRIQVVNGEEVEVGPPSFAAITASICRTGMPYMMHIQAQQKAGKGAAEVITGLHLIVRKFLLAYNNFTKVKPVKIIYFRDGVGDGQFQEVLRTEMGAIREACQSLHASYQPRITFVTVQKRHKTRFFLPVNNTCENAPPGTVVDTDIVHPVENDFYLLSHKGLLGTSRPTRYHVLWDDSDFSMNEIQTMAYYLCYMFVRCNRSVKIPAPTYYAHWAAKRAEILSKGWVENYYHDIRGLNNELGKREEQFASIYPMHFV